ncbi:aminotransferase class III-fold pyridoxal phosphate-dependent enzyme [Aquibacillus halophilus]|uniref:Aminotransferase class III-fold pyridoxal phosphate-dependent enzyme n=1 Tax=Aquibacillus halophilus TaxID=930132 RepID=A0A6A8DFR8_9BACI|nr:aspartate aminotransferase family protein [Aquibacillus halophilus]MRH41707.1 aminotransferase class III-fold pyridoxal phosphate-dependent enzyme [Aquibacillus halophilus]
MTESLSMNQSRIQELAELDKKYFLHPTTAPKTHAEEGPKIMFSEGKGIFVNDMNGDSYIDGVSMLWNVNLGHGQLELAETAKEQMSKLAYSSSFIGYSNEPAVRLAEKLVSLAPGDLNSVFYTSGGSEANDTAFKLARFYWELKGKPQKRKFIALEDAYHGVTIAAQTATSIPNFHTFSNSGISDVFHAKPHLTNCELGDKSDPNYEGCIRDIIEKEGADTIAGIIMEPIQGSGGVHIPPDGYLQAVRELCDELGILFIADEVITGFGRTGLMFGVENWDVVPDLLCFAKGVTSGYAQLGGVLIRQHIRDTIVQYEGVLSHGFTYSGHATACAVALKNIEIIERDNIVVNAKMMEQELKKGFEYLKSKHPMVTKTRAIGLLSAIELYENSDTNKPFDISVKATAQVGEECFKRKLMIRPIRVGEGKNIIAIAPPLVINKQEIEQMISIIDESITAFEKILT